MLSRFCHAAVAQFRAPAFDLAGGTLLEVRVGAQRTSEGRRWILWTLLPLLLWLSLLLCLLLLQLLLLGE